MRGEVRNGSSPRTADPRISRRRAASLALCASLLSSCAQEGDFGRPQPGAWNGLVEKTGALAAAARDEPVSFFAFTDDEQTLRERAWRFLMPAAGRDAFLDVVANLTRARVLPPDWAHRDVAAYHETLVGGDARSPVSRYRRLSEDATADARLIPPFVAIAQRVVDADAMRLRSLPFARTLDDAAVREAAMRVAENRCVIAWVRLETGLRAERYRYALEHLFAATPSDEGAATERTITGFAARRTLLDPVLPADAAARCGLAPALAVQSPIVTKS